MTDTLTKSQRSANMSKVRAKNTGPELLIRSALFKSGFRYRLHAKKLPGCPDIVLPKYRAIIFVHGCFWHGHSCKAGKLPDTNRDFWTSKIQGNKKRDRSNKIKLVALGWRYLTVWECSLKNKRKDCIDHLIKKISDWIKSGTGNKVIR